MMENADPGKGNQKCAFKWIHSKMWSCTLAKTYAIVTILCAYLENT